MRGVTLKKAVLTHEIRRELHIDLTLPGTGAEMWHENTGFGSIEALQDGGRLLLFEGTDEAHFATAKMHRDSRLSLAAQLPEPTQPGTGLRRYEKASLTYSYSFHQAKKDMGTGEFKAQVGAYADKYLDWQFPPGAFSLWANELERKAAKAGGGKLGNTLIALELVVPPAAGKAWLDKAPAMGSDLCLTMSVNLQNALKELIPFYYFQDMNRYKNVEAVAPLLVWAAIPAKKEDGLHWNYPDKETVREKVNSWETQQGLTAALGKIYVALDKAGLSEVAKIYLDDHTPADLCDFALGGAYEGLQNLLNREAQIVRGAAKAADKLANFRGHREWGPERAIKALADLAGCLAEAFNDNVWSVYGKGALRPLGTLLFTEAARAFDPENPELAPKGGSALLRVEILEPSVPFPPAGFPNHSALAKDQVLVEQAVVSSALALSSPRTPGILLNESSEAPAELVHA